MKFLLSVTLALSIWAQDASAVLPVSGEFAPRGLDALIARGVDDYRLGDEWGKYPVTADSLASATPAFKRAAMATAKVGGATGFFLGKFNGALVMATNHHVYSSSFSCGAVRFPLLNLRGSCDKFYGTWPEVDLALFSIRLDNPADEAKLLAVAGNFAFKDPVLQGQKLLTIGFGVAGNQGGQLMANQDSDCYVFSQDSEYRLMADPDEFNPGSYRAWSFSTSCDVSHGDSGSAMVDRETSKVTGIIWTGRIPKKREIQSSAYLSRLFQDRGEEIWQELSYAVPAEKIGVFLNGLLQTGIPEGTKATLRELLK